MRPLLKPLIAELHAWFFNQTALLSSASVSRPLCSAYHPILTERNWMKEVILLTILAVIAKMAEDGHKFRAHRRAAFSILGVYECFNFHLHLSLGILGFVAARPSARRAPSRAVKSLVNARAGRRCHGALQSFSLSALSRT